MSHFNPKNKRENQCYMHDQKLAVHASIWHTVRLKQFVVRLQWQLRLPGAQTTAIQRGIVDMGTFMTE